MIHTDIKPENILLETNEREAHATAKTIKELWTTGHQLPSAAGKNKSTITNPSPFRCIHSFPALLSQATWLSNEM